MLPRLAHLAATNTVAFLRLLSMGDRGKDIGIRAPRTHLEAAMRKVVPLIVVPHR
ncbi:hypothetical protein ACIGXM_31785 [Kitasatospora sp. NPDC052896]|uniref:hypothetical protein n=1 Tax=Kitasatospora sp. NPDC052896 TaxID=3364061 RepID=UPI0037C6636A